MRPRPISGKDTAVVLPTILRRATKITSSPEERLSCAVAELRDSVWSEILHIARCWKVDPQELIKASGRP
jgi:restriction endonuclease Mrr